MKRNILRFTLALDSSITGCGHTRSRGRLQSMLAGLAGIGLRIIAGGAMLAGGTAYAAVPVLNTPTSSGITGTGATLGGNVASDGGAAISARGVVYSVTSINNNPQINGTGVHKVTTAGTTGVFTIPVSALYGSTPYSFRAFATNSAGTSYTTPVSTFTTGTALSGPTGFSLPVETAPPSMATQWVICISGSFPSSGAVPGDGMTDNPVVGEIRNVAFSPTAGSFSSQFLPCDGRLLSISQNSALYALLGTTYGGNGSSNFALPDLRGRVPMHFSAANPLGSLIGAETTTLAVANLAAHTHSVPLGANTGSTGSGTPFSIQQPALALNLRIMDNVTAASVGWVRVFAFSFSAGITACDGAAYARSGGDWAALFSEIGTTYGAGNGSTTFNVPDLRNRTMIGQGTGTGLTARTLGQSGGSGTASMTVFTMPSHDHTLLVGTTGLNGRGGSIGIMSPFLVLNPTIALSGLNASITATPAMGEVRFRADSAAPAGWVGCSGSVLSIAQNPTLFSLLGTTYGGNGTTTFGVPDMRGRSVTSADNGAGVPFDITSRNRGATWGDESVTLTSGQLPSHSHSYTTYDADSPEIAVSGNFVNIADGDATPLVNDNTDFGVAGTFAGTVTRTFTIQNTGGGLLNLTGSPKVALSGAHAADFTITAQPASPVAPITGTTTFQVTFDPSGSGLRTATVSIANDDTNEDPFDFSIQGEGDDAVVDTLPPSMATQWVICISGSFPDSGAVPGDGMTDNPVMGEIRNVAFAADAGNFSSQFLPCDGRTLSVSQNTSLYALLGTTYGGNGASTFALPDLRGRVPVHFSAANPLGSIIGAESTTLTIANLPPHTHTAPGGTVTGSTGSGTGFSVQQPALALNLRIMDNGAADSIGWVRLFAFSFSAGITACDGTAYARSGGAWAALFSKISTTYGAGNGSTTFNVPDLRNRAMIGQGTGTGLTARTLGQSLGSSTAAMTLATMPPHDHVLSVGASGFTGGGGAIAKMSPCLVLNPTIALTGLNASITATPALGEVRFRAVSAAPAGWVGCNGSVLTVAQNPTLFALLGTTFGGNGTTTFGVPDMRGRSVTCADDGADALPGITPRARGAVWGAETLTLDAAQLPAHTHSFTVPPSAEIAVEGNGVNIADGDAVPSLADHTNFGSVATGSSTMVRTFTIRNIGSIALNLTGTPKVTITGAQAADFTVNAQPVSPVTAIGGTTTFQVTFQPGATGVRTASVNIASNDADENPFNFAISGQGTNTAPTDITLSSTIIDESNAATATVGTLSTTDADAGQSFSYSLAAGAGDTANGSFTISGNALRITPSANFEVKNSYSVRVSVSDGAASFAKPFTVTIRNINEPPAFAKGANRSHPVLFNTAQSVSGWATAIDDGDSTVTQALTFNVTNTNNSLFSVQPALSANGTLTYTTSGTAGSATVSVSLTDDNSINGFPALTSAVQTFVISVDVPDGTGLAIQRITIQPGGDVLIEFSVTDAHTYRIEYSHDLNTWHQAQPVVVPEGILEQWLDQGPPGTLSHPSTVSRRYYRVRDITSSLP